MKGQSRARIAQQEKMDEAGLVGEAERPLQSENVVFPRAVPQYPPLITKDEITCVVSLSAY